MTEAALADYPKTVVLKDGTHLLLRPMTPSDRDAVTALRADPGSGAADAVVVACAGECVVGVTVLERTASEAAAVTVVLDPGYRGRRLGTWMLLDCVHLAAGLGVTRLEAVARAGDDAYVGALLRLDFVADHARTSASRFVLVKTLHVAWTDF